MRRTRPLRSPKMWVESHKMEHCLTDQERAIFSKYANIFPLLTMELKVLPSLTFQCQRSKTPGKGIVEVCSIGCSDSSGDVVLRPCTPGPKTSIEKTKQTKTDIKRLHSVGCGKFFIRLARNQIGPLCCEAYCKEQLYQNRKNYSIWVDQEFHWKIKNGTRPSASMPGWCD